MGIFKRKTKAKSMVATAPEEDESTGEIKHIEELAGNVQPMYAENPAIPAPQPVQQPVPQQPIQQVVPQQVPQQPIQQPAQQPIKEEQQESINYREIPVCMSQSQINNLVIENNIMLKQIMTELD